MFRKRIFCALLALALCLGGCASQSAPEPSASSAQAAPRTILQRLNIQTGEGGEPVLDVYVKEESQIRTMGIEEYLMGVLAGEMRSDWPIEALKAQAIIARTFAMKFLNDEGGSKYEGADISTDIEEAQAYNASGVDERIRQAIEETRGLVILYEDELAYTWFHSHAGGQTALASEGLEYESDPPYIVCVASDESAQAPEDVQSWTVGFSAQEIIDAAATLGITLDSVSDFSIAQTGPSGRATVFSCDGQQIPAASLRIALGADRLKSTLLKDVAAAQDAVIFRGSGYGHGVGMSQWGAYQMAEDGKTAQEIIQHYYTDVEILSMWE